MKVGLEQKVSQSQLEKSWYQAECRQCPRLASFLSEIKQKYPAYYCRPVAPFGEQNAELLVVGLAPGMHGANASGRPFTGDFAGVLLYQTLYKFQFASSAESISAQDGLKLHNCRITNAVKCLPPQNKPTTDEEKTCNAFLRAELKQADLKVIIALGSVAHRAILRANGLTLSQFPFSHAAEHELGNGQVVIDSYHCSRYNTQTKRLTSEMFEQVFALAQARLNR